MKSDKIQEQDEDSCHCPRCGEWFPTLTDGRTRHCLGSTPDGVECGYEETAAGLDRQSLFPDAAPTSR